jgi:dipeptidyl-peptidase-4
MYNTIRQFLVVTALLLSTSGLIAQPKKLTMEDVVMRQRTLLAPKRLPQLQWIPGSSNYAFVESVSGEDQLMKGSVNGKSAAVLTLSELNAALRAANADTVAKLPLLSWKDANSVSFDAGKKAWLWSFTAKKLSVADKVVLPENAEKRENGPNGILAWVEDNNIWVERNGQRKQVTTDGKYELVYGNSVHREEFGIEKGLFWSDKGARLAFYRMDQSMVTDYPLVDFNERPAKEKAVKYPMSGAASHEVTVGIYEVNSGKTVFLKTGEPGDQYLTNISWSPDERFVYMAVLNRAQDHFKFNQYDAVTGEFVKTLFEERDNKYAEPLHPCVFVSGKPTQFIWQSRRDGWNHLYLYATDGKLIRQLTKGEFEVTSFDGFDLKGTRAFFHATGNTGVNRDFWMVELASGKMTKLTNEDGVHSCMLNDTRSMFIDTYSSNTVPRIIQIRETAAGKVLSTLLKADNPLKDYTAGSTRLFQIKGEDGTPLWCRLILPADFDSTKKYPVIVYVYGGPHAQMITNTWLGGADLWFHYLTQQGYIVFTLDNRGSANRGKAFEQATFRNLGEPEMKDQISGVNYLRKLKYVDGNRLGVNGWSYGGFMATSLMTRYPGIFKVAVAGGPVIDWSYYEVMYTERYMDTPEENPAGYKLNNLLNYVDQLNGKLMLIHGTSDDVVVWQHSLMYLKKAVSKGVQVDYFVYPGHPHNVMGKDRMHLNEKIIRYFNDYLK